jgi:hypothetical protein
MKYLLTILALVFMLAACKTSEANYRAAYEKAVTARDEANDDEAVYGGVSRQLKKTYMLNGDDTVAVSVKMVSPVAEDGEAAPLKYRFMVVAGQFKQKFNALSLSRRLAAGSYPGAMVVQTSEPYYYVVAVSCASLSEADKALQDIKKKAPVPMKDPIPFILSDPRK